MIHINIFILQKICIKQIYLHHYNFLYILAIHLIININKYLYQNNLLYIYFHLNNNFNHIKKHKYHINLNMLLINHYYIMICINMCYFNFKLNVL